MKLFSTRSYILLYLLLVILTKAYSGKLILNNTKNHELRYAIINATTNAASIKIGFYNGRKDKENIITTEYEDKFTSKGNVIYFVEVINNEQ